MRIFIILIFFANSVLWAQPRLIKRPTPVNDLCKNAITLQINQWKENQTNESCAIQAAETPAAIPYTCIKTFENDLWYVFEAEENTPMELFIATQACMTPAGLQCLIIQTNDCLSPSFKYIACANKENLDTVRCYFEVEKGQKYHVYVDGFDGNVCDFSLGVFTRKKPWFVKEDCIYRRVELGESPLPEMDVQLVSGMKNNYPTIRFSDPNLQDALYYQVQIWKEHYWYTVGCLDPSVMTSGNNPEIKYSDFSIQDYSKPLKYRLIKVTRDDKRFANLFTIEPKLIQTLQVSQPKMSQTPNIFNYHFQNKKKQNLSIEILDEQMKIVKSKQLKNHEIGLQESSIDLNGFKSGIYLLKFCCPEGCFEYELVVK